MIRALPLLAVLIQASFARGDGCIESGWPVPERKTECASVASGLVTGWSAASLATSLDARSRSWMPSVGCALTSKPLRGFLLIVR